MNKTLSSKFYQLLTSAKSQKVAFSSLLFSTTLGLLLVVAIGVYSLFYIITMPSIFLSQPLHLEYNSTTIQSLNYIKLQYGKYNFNLKLATPDTLQNFNLGNFMINCQLRNDKTLIKSITKSAHLKYKSSLHRTLSTLANILFLLLDLKLEQSIQTINLFDSNVDKSFSSLYSLQCFIDNPKLETYSSFLLISTLYEGLPYFMYHWFITTSLFFISIIMFTEIIILTFIYNRYSKYFIDLKHGVEFNYVKDDVLSLSDSLSAVSAVSAVSEVEFNSDHVSEVEFNNVDSLQEDENVKPANYAISNFSYLPKDHEEVVEGEGGLRGIDSVETITETTEGIEAESNQDLDFEIEKLLE